MWGLRIKGPSGFSGSSTAEQVTEGINGNGLTAIVTGASSGIGTETARVLALRGVHVIIGVRNVAAGRDVKEAIARDIPYAKIDAMELDLSSMDSVTKFASEFKSSGLPLNLLINNAGVMATPFMLSKDKIELQFATNYLGHFLLTNLLLGMMKKTARDSGKEGRIVNISSRRHQLSYPEGIRFDKINDPSGYDALSAYGQSKLANVLHANELARCLKEEEVNITANSVSPGVVATNIFRHHAIFRERGQRGSNGTVNVHMERRINIQAIYASSLYGAGLATLVGRLIVKNVQQGAATTCYVALHPNVKGITGKYFEDCNLAKASAQSNDADLAKKLWDYSESLTR